MNTIFRTNITVQRKQIVKWDLDDIAMMKQITKPESQKYMFDKHGVEMQKLLKAIY